MVEAGDSRLLSFSVAWFMDWGVCYYQHGIVLARWSWEADS